MRRMTKRAAIRQSSPLIKPRRKPQRSRAKLRRRSRARLSKMQLRPR